MRIHSFIHSPLVYCPLFTCSFLQIPTWTVYWDTMLKILGLKSLTAQWNSATCLNCLQHNTKRVIIMEVSSYCHTEEEVINSAWWCVKRERDKYYHVRISKKRSNI